MLMYLIACFLPRAIEEDKKSYVVSYSADQNLETALHFICYAKLLLHFVDNSSNLYFDPSCNITLNNNLRDNLRKIRTKYWITIYF